MGRTRVKDEGTLAGRGREKERENGKGRRGKRGGGAVERD